VSTYAQLEQPKVLSPRKTRFAVNVSRADSGNNKPIISSGEPLPVNLRISSRFSQSILRASAMYLSNQSLLVIIVVGIVAGWLAGRVMEGGGFGLIGDLVVGLIGAFIGDWLLP
jgi:hypothetical protein